jgi:hypothetical protein
VEPGDLGQQQLPVDQLFARQGLRIVTRARLSDAETDCRLHVGQRDRVPTDAGQHAIDKAWSASSAGLRLACAGREYDAGGIQNAKCKMQKGQNNFEFCNFP